MTDAIERSCYVTREEVMRALDVKPVAYNSQQIDRQIVMASETVEETCKRNFYIIDDTKLFDWPNFQYAYPWRLWLDKWELAAAPTLFVTGALLPQPIVIPAGNYICQPYNSGPPYTSIELRRDLNSSFGYNSTPQQDIGITGSFGYWVRTKPGGSITAAISTATTTTITVTSSATPGIGDTIGIDTERMIVQDRSAVNTGVSFNAFTTASAADNVCAVADGTQFAVGEVLTVDNERMLILTIIGNNLTVKRGWDGTVLAAHTSGTLYADRQLTVIRGANGTTAATHVINAGISVYTVPGLVKEQALAEAVIGLTQEPSAYAFDLESRSRVEQNVYGGTGHGQQREPAIGIGIQDLRDRTAARYGRQMRSRVI